MYSILSASNKSPILCTLATLLEEINKRMKSVIVPSPDFESIQLVHTARRIYQSESVRNLITSEYLFNAKCPLMLECKITKWGRRNPEIESKVLLR